MWCVCVCVCVRLSAFLLYMCTLVTAVRSLKWSARQAPLLKQNRHINFLNINFLPLKLPSCAPLNKCMCLISWERTQKKAPTSVGFLGQSKGSQTGHCPALINPTPCSCSVEPWRGKKGWRKTGIYGTLQQQRLPNVVLKVWRNPNGYQNADSSKLRELAILKPSCFDTPLDTQTGTKTNGYQNACQRFKNSKIKLAILKTIRFYTSLDFVEKLSLKQAKQNPRRDFIEVRVNMSQREGVKQSSCGAVYWLLFPPTDYSQPFCLSLTVSYYHLLS